MAAKEINIRIESLFNDAGFRRAVQSVQRLAKEIQKSNVEMQRVVKQARELSAESNRAAQSMQKLATESGKASKNMSTLANASDRAAKGMDSMDRSADRANQGVQALGRNTQGAQQHVTRLAAGMRATATAAQASTRSVTRNAQAVAQTARSAQQAQTQTSGLRRVLGTLNTVVGQTQRMLSQVNRIALQVARALGTAFANGVTRAVRAVSTLLSQGARFASLRSSLDATGRSASRFGADFEKGMKQANRSAMEFYAAGWSLLMGGQMVGGVGRRMLGGIGGQLNEYLEYEQMRTKAGIASMIGQDGQIVPGDIQNQLLNKMVFGLQRGDYGAPIAMGSQEIAQGTYYLASALGQPITNEEQAAQVAKALAPMLSVATFTNTNPETAIKGVINAAMEFGFDPRAQGSDKVMADIASQFGYLTQVSTLELPDIVETFKQFGPLMNLIGGEDNQKNLDDAMLLTFLTSEMGLRGSRVGTGLAQAFNSLIDPTLKMDEISEKQFGGSVDETFFDDKGDLKGGIMGFLSNFVGLGDKEWQSVAAGMFTTNATRNLIPIIEQLRNDPEKVMAFSEQISGDAPMAMTDAAIARYNESIAGHLQQVKNAWFEVQTAIIDSISGPLKGAMEIATNLFRTLADILNNHPLIAKFLTGIVSVMGILLTFVGSLLTVAGTLLILRRAFMLTHGSMNIVAALFTALPHMLLVGLPILLALAAAAVLLHRAWSENFLGIQDLVENLNGNLSLYLDPIISIVEGMAIGLAGIFSDKVNAQFDRFVKWLPTIRGELQAVLRVLTAFGKGVVEGVISVFLVLAKAAQIAIDVLQKVPGALRWVNGTVRELTGFNGTLEELGRIVGFAFGAFVAGKIAASMLFFNSVIGQATMRLASFIVQTVLLNAARAIFTAVGTAAHLMFNVVIMGAVRATAAIWAFVASIAASASVSMGIALVAFAAVALAIGVIVAAFVHLMATSETFRANVVSVFQSLISIVGDFAYGVLQGLIAGFTVLVAVVQPVVQALFALLAPLLQSVDQMGLAEAAGIALGIAIAALAAIILGSAVIAFASWIIGMLPMIALLAAITAAVYIVGEAIASLLGYDSVFTALADAFPKVADAGVWAAQRIGDAWGWLKEQIQGTTIEIKEFSLAEAKQTALEFQQLQSDLVPSMVSEAVGKWQAEWGKIWVDQNGASGLQEEVMRQHDYYSNFFTNDPTGQGQVRHRALQESGVYMVPDITDPTGQRELALDPGQYAYYGIDPKTTSELVRTNTPIDPSYYTPERIAENKPYADAYKNSLGGTSFDWSSLRDQVLGGLTIEDVVSKLGIDFNSDQLMSQLTGSGAYTSYDQIERELKKRAFDSKVADLYEQSTGRNLNADMSGSSSYLFDPSRGQASSPGVDAVALAEANAAAAGLLEESADSLDEASANLAAIQSEFATAIESIDLGQALKGIYGPYAGKGTSAAEALFGYSETIMSNLQNAVGSDVTLPWQNQFELMMDAAGSGNSLGQSVTGKNLHQALAPFLETFASQSGVAVETLLKDIPLFHAPEQYLGMGQANLIDAAQHLPTNMYQNLDLLGSGRHGTAVYDAEGLDWSELANYGTAQAATGNLNWNLADFIAEAWDISKADAEAYISANQLNPEVITGQDFFDTKMYADTLGGQVNVLPQEWWDYLMSVTQDGADKTIEMTQAAFDALPDVVKIGFSNMGYSFVLGGDAVGQQAITTAQAVKKNIEDNYGNIPDHLSKLLEEGDWTAVDSNLDGLIEISDGLGNLKFTIPAGDYAAWVESNDILQQEKDRLQGLKDDLETLKQDIRDLSSDIASSKETNDWVNENFAGNSGFGDMALGNMQSSLSTLKADANQIRQDLGWITGEGLTTPEAINLDLEPYKTAGKDAATEFSTSFATSLQTEITAALPEPPQVKLTLDREELLSRLVDTEVLLSKLDNEPYTATLAVDKQQAMADFQAAYNSLMFDWEDETFTTIMAVTDNASVSIGTVIGLLQIGYARTFTATLALKDYASWTISNAITLLDTLDGKIATSTIQTIHSDIYSAGSSVPQFAQGGMLQKGWNIVGEDGMELVWNAFGSSSRAVPNSLAAPLMSSLLERSVGDLVGSRGGYQSHQIVNNGGGGSGGDGDGQVIVHFHGDNHFHNGTDVDQLVDRIDYLVGKRAENASRGQYGGDSARYRTN